MQQSIRFTSVFTLGLMLAMWATRGSHFDSVVNLPDASLALFLIAGFYLRSQWPLWVLILQAGGLDYFSITAGGVSDFCVTNAYFMLIPAYGCMWLAGRWLNNGFQWRRIDGLRFVLATMVSTNIAFHLSSGGFYLFSGYFSDPTWAEYGQRVVAYLPSYVGIASAYLALAALVALILAQAFGVGRKVGRVVG